MVLYIICGVTILLIIIGACYVFIPEDEYREMNKDKEE